MRYSSLPEAVFYCLYMIKYSLHNKENKMELKKLMEHISITPDYR
ncbi:hypothetical protein ECMP02155211_0510 [Escherichia coli MP021552.11]|nr:hypothetical protein ECMP02155211_0510 [Escherichia coli MP021552.11]